MGSFLRKLRDRHVTTGNAGAGRDASSRPALRISSSGSSGGNLDPLQAFRRKYPMDDRAWDFLTTCSSGVQRRVMGDFRPRSEGDSDYSGLITSFVRTIRNQM